MFHMRKILTRNHLNESKQKTVVELWLDVGNTTLQQNARMMRYLYKHYLRKKNNK